MKTHIEKSKKRCDGFGFCLIFVVIVIGMVVGGVGYLATKCINKAKTIQKIQEQRLNPTNELYTVARSMSENAIVDLDDYSSINPETGEYEYDIPEEELVSIIKSIHEYRIEYRDSVCSGEWVDTGNVITADSNTIRNIMIYMAKTEGELNPQIKMRFFRAVAEE